MGYSDDAIITLTIQAQDLSGSVVDDAVTNLDGLATASGDAGQALVDLQTTSDTALGGISDNAQQVVTDAGDIGPAFADAIDSVDTAPAIDELGNLSEQVDSVGQDIEDVGVNIDGAFSGANKKAIKGVAQVLDDVAGTNFKPVVGGLLQLSNIAKPFKDTIEAGLSSVMTGLGAKLAPLGAAVGTLVGEAQAVAQQAAATGTAAIGAMASRISAMAIPLAPAGTTVGTAIGAGISSGIIAGISGAGLALLVQNELTKIDIKTPAGWDLFPDWNQNIAQHNAAAAAAGTTTATSFADAYGTTAQAAMASFISSERAENDAAYAAMGTSAGEAFTGDLATALQNNTNVIDTAMDKVQWAIEHPMELLAQEAQLQGAIQQLQYKRGMESNSDEVNTVIDQQIAALEAQWLFITGKAYDSGYNAQAAYARGVLNAPRVRIGANVGGSLTDLDTGHHYSGGGRAHGGPVGAHGIYEVNEPGGPEMLTVGGRNFLLMGNRSGYVDPLDGSGGRGSFGGGGTLDFHFHYHGLGQPTPAEGQRMAQMFVPELVRELRRQRIM